MSAVQRIVLVFAILLVGAVVVVPIASSSVHAGNEACVGGKSC
jgi:hypothetical protein